MSDVTMSDFHCYAPDYAYDALTGLVYLFYSFPGLHPGPAYDALSGLREQTKNTITCAAK